MFNKQSISLAVSSGLLMSSSAFACLPPTGPVIGITGAGTVPFDATMKVFEAGMMKVNMDIVSALNSVKNTMSEQSSMLSQTIIESKQSEMNNMIETNRTAMELVESHKVELAKIKSTADKQLIPMDGLEGGPSEAYFAKMCAANKVSGQVWGEASEAIIADAVQKAEVSLTNATKNTSRAAEGRKVQLKHYTTYCSQNSVDLGLCETPAKIPNADILAYVAVQPSNDPDKAVIADLGMKTKYTYSDFEAQAAKDYYENILQSTKLPQPQLYGANSSPEKVARYNQLKAAQSLANYTFSISQTNRTPVDKGAQSVSKWDKIRYLLKKAETDDLTAALTATEKGRMVFLLNHQALGNSLRLEKQYIQERINNLSAALLAVRLSDPDKVKYINSMK